MKQKSSDIWKKFDSIKDNEIDLSDIPKISKSILKKMVVRYPDQKKAISIRLDSDVLSYFRQYGKGYQTKINAVLKGFMTASQA